MNEKQVSMFIIVTYSSGKLIDIERNIRRITLRRLYQSSPTNVDVYLPRFKLEITNNLNDYLREVKNSKHPYLFYRLKKIPILIAFFF